MSRPFSRLLHPFELTERPQFEPEVRIAKLTAKPTRQHKQHRGPSRNDNWQLPA
jgi:hypothetical protein